MEAYKQEFIDFMVESDVLQNLENSQQRAEGRPRSS